MPRSLADLRKSPHVGRPETLLPVCVAGKLTAEFDRVEAELDKVLTERPQRVQSEDGEPTGPPKRMGRRGPDPRIAELNDRREQLRDEMAAHTVTLLLRAREDGLWRNWVNEHPPRDADRLDQAVGHDVDALIVDIRDNPRDYVAAINDEPFSDDDWLFVWNNAGDGDKWRMAATVRNLHQQGVDVPKSLTDWLGTVTSEGSSS